MIDIPVSVTSAVEWPMEGVTTAVAAGSGMSYETAGVILGACALFLVVVGFWRAWKGN